MSPCGHFLYPSCGCKPPAPVAAPQWGPSPLLAMLPVLRAAAALAPPRCEQGLIDIEAPGFGRCPNAATDVVVVHPLRTVQVCAQHNVPDSLRAHTHVFKREGKPDVVVVSGMWGEG